MAERLVWIDWLKVIVVAGVFVYHTAEPFLLINWVVSNDERSVVLSALAGFGFLFGMPLMFLLTGATAWLSLGRRPLSAYGMARVRRLLLPLVAGIAILTPLQWWLAAAIARGGENPLNTIAWFFGGMRFEPTSRWFGDYGMHLWFIAFLFAYSILCLPLLGALRRPVGARLLGRLAELPRPALLLLLFAPILASQLLLRIPTPEYRDWADFALWLGFYIVGVILLADRRLLNAVVDSGPRLIVVGVGLVGLGLVAVVLARIGRSHSERRCQQPHAPRDRAGSGCAKPRLHRAADGRGRRAHWRMPLDRSSLVPLTAVLAAASQPRDPAVLRPAPPRGRGGGRRGGAVVDGPLGQAGGRARGVAGRQPGAHRAGDANRCRTSGLRRRAGRREPCAGHSCAVHDS